MKTIGLIGGLTWLSTVDYYRLINQMVNDRLGGAEAAKIILYSVNFAEIKPLTEAGKWDEILEIIADVSKKVEAAGADCIVLCANTVHRVADGIAASVNIPLIHIADETAKEIKKKNLNKVALLGTKYTMQLDFYKQKLSEYGIETIIPDDQQIEYVNHAIFDEMHKGRFCDEMKQKFLVIINDLVQKGAQGIILGCTEIPILIKQEDCSVPTFDTTEIHAIAAVEFSLSR